MSTTLPKRIASFEPIINSESRILILGTMPGAESLRMQQYYANRYNHFWRIMSSLLKIDPESSYPSRIQAVLSNRIGIWDVFASCYREGSLDSNIKDGAINDFHALFQQYPSISHIVFNGGKAYDEFRKKIGFLELTGKTFIKMPSTSPAHTKPYEYKLAEWSILSTLLGDQNNTETSNVSIPNHA